MPNTNLSKAKNAKMDEFYTQFYDIEKEVNAYLEYNPNVFEGKTILCPCDDPFESNFFKYFALHFYNFKLKKLIATCYAGSPISNTQLSLFPDESEENKTTRQPHKIEITEIPVIERGRGVNLYDVKALLASDKNHLTRLQGDGDFRSKEIKLLRDEADVIVTNPPFSLFREFLEWIVKGDKQFLIIGNMNAITCKEVFPLIKDNKIWLGASIHSGDREFAVPDDYPLFAAGYRVDEKGKKYIRVKGVRWFTNLDHGRRHEPLQLMPLKDNLRYDKRLKGKEFYDKYDNYNAIEVPFTDAIPSDYEDIMGVPISFLDKYCPEQFEILGNEYDLNISKGRGYINGKRMYSRIFIKHR